MSVIERAITVTYRHRVHFTDRVFDVSNGVLAEVLGGGGGRQPRVLVVVDEALSAARPGLLEEIAGYFAARPCTARLVCPPVVMPGGEAVKNNHFRVTAVQALIDRHHIDRHSYVVAVGGGALLDMAGFAAATAHRGVRHVRIPTTTLAQADSGVGVKNGINAFGKKNFVGAFAPPHAVVNDFGLLATLPERDRRAGFAEAVKVACIRDAAFFAEIEADADALSAFEPGPVRRVIRRSAELHLGHIADGGDPFETGSARPLDFGHWAAHKLEQLSDHRLRHGEAVAIGIALDVEYSRLRGLLATADAGRVVALLERLGFELYADELQLADESGRPCVLNGVEEFREHLGGELTVTLLAAIGRGIEVHELSEVHVLAALRGLRARHQARTTGRVVSMAAA
jgi:3-dehydroquinate synthase